MLGEQTSSAGEAARAPRLRLVRAHRAGLAGPEAIWGEEAWGTLAWKPEVMAQAGGRSRCLGPDSALNPHLSWGRALRLGVVLGWGELGGRSLGCTRPAPQSGCCQWLRHCGALAGLGFTSPTSKKGYKLKSKWLGC